MILLFLNGVLQPCGVEGFYLIVSDFNAADSDFDINNIGEVSTSLLLDSYLIQHRSNNNLIMLVDIPHLRQVCYNLKLQYKTEISSIVSSLFWDNSLDYPVLGFDYKPLRKEQLCHVLKSKN